MVKFSVVAAATWPNLGIGYQGGLPWKSLKPDMKYFKNLTSTPKTDGLRNVVIMGRKTWESIPSKFRPLSNRINVVLSRNPEFTTEDEEVKVFQSFNVAINSVPNMYSDMGEVFVIGGSQVYEQALKHECLSQVYITKVYKSFDCDCFLPMDVSAFFCQSVSIEKFEDIPYEFCILRKHDAGNVYPIMRHLPKHEEWQYLDTIRDCIEHGTERGDRTGTGTLSHFGRTMRFSLRNNTFPLLTTKKVFWRGVAEELLWFVSGSTNANLLSEKRIHFWDANGSRDFLDKLGFKDREVGDLGPVYGFQWRHFGAEYTNMNADYTGKGVDQLATVIDCIKNNPNSRRIVLTAWNPKDQGKMALPPCHMFCQFYIANGELSCQMYQRSADMGLGVPFNIASYSLLTRMIAQVCGLKAGEFIHAIGDCHVYLNHVEPLREQLKRQPRPFPTLEINPEVKSIDSFKYSDFKIVDYKPYKNIKMKMAV